MKYVFIIFGILFLLGFVASGLIVIFSQKGFTFKSVVNRVAGTLQIIGALGFFAAFTFASANIAGVKFEWPIGTTSSAYPHIDDSYIVLHQPSGRVQIYDNTLKYIRGWGVNSYGGTFNLLPAEDDTFFIYTARGDMKYLYNLEGELLSSEKYTTSFPFNREHLEKLSIPTPFYLWGFTHPLKAWLLMVLGIILLQITDRKEQKKKYFIG